MSSGRQGCACISASQESRKKRKSNVQICKSCIKSRKTEGEF